MKKYKVFILALIFSLPVLAQENETGQLFVTAIQLEDPLYSEEVRQNLETKMQRIIQNGGMLSESGSRFVMTTRIDVTEKDITSQGMFLQKMEVTFYLLDVISDKVFGMASIKVTGVEESESRALIKAFQNIKPTHPSLSSFLSTAKQNIQKYFEEETPTILSDAQFKAAQGSFDEAYSMLLTVPSMCRTEYGLCRAKAVEIYALQREQQRDAINKDGKVLIQKANSVWAGKQDYESAITALTLLAEVDPDSECRADADNLVNLINEKLRATEKELKEQARQRRAEQWAFQLQQYKDQIELKNREMDALNTLVSRFGKIEFNVQKDKTYRFGRAKK